MARDDDTRRLCSKRGAIQSLNPVMKALGVGTAVAVLFTILFMSGLLETLELKTLDFRFHLFAKRLKPSQDIVIVTIDQNSIDYLKYRLGIVWQWPRDVYANVIRYLSNARARAILLDLDLSDPDINRAEFEEGETDRLLESAMKDSGIVVNSALFYREEKAVNSWEGDYIALKHFSVPVPGRENLNIGESLSVVMPILPFLRHSMTVGASNIYPDRDGIVRRAQLFQKFRSEIYANSALSLVLKIIHDSGLAISRERRMALGGKTIILNDKGETYINWYGPGGPAGNTYRYYSIADMLLSYLRMRDGLRPIIPPEAFRNKIVLIGSNAPSLYDLKPTPFSEETAYPGVEIIATLINNLLDGTALSRPGRSSAIVLIFLCCLVTSFCLYLSKSVYKNIIVALSLMAAALFLAIAAFHRNIFLNIVPMEAGIFFSFIGITLLDYLTEGREKRWLKKAFAQYLSPAVIKEITEHPEKLKLGGEKREITILFSDIRGFTSLAEKLDPEQVANILNEYFTPMTEIVFRNSGTLDKYMGDAVMAFFGAPLHLENHHECACNAALEMVRELDELKGKWGRHQLPDFIQHMNIGIGINSGPVSVGNMGSEARFNYTVIGDHVNLSSRLESINKVYGTNIVVSYNTYRETAERFIFRELDLIRVAGKSIPITIYELKKRRDGSREDERLEEDIRRFMEGLALYRERQWEKAIEIFRSLLDHDPHDRVCSVFIERCSQLGRTSLPHDWDGVYERSTK